MTNKLFSLLILDVILPDNSIGFLRTFNNIMYNNFTDMYTILTRLTYTQGPTHTLSSLSRLFGWKNVKQMVHNTYIVECIKIPGE